MPRTFLGTGISGSHDCNGPVVSGPKKTSRLNVGAWWLAPPRGPLSDARVYGSGVAWCGCYGWVDTHRCPIRYSNNRARSYPESIEEGTGAMDCGPFQTSNSPRSTSWMPLLPRLVGFLRPLSLAFLLSMVVRCSASTLHLGRFSCNNKSHILVSVVTPIQVSCFPWAGPQLLTRSQTPSAGVHPQNHRHCQYHYQTVRINEGVHHRFRHSDTRGHRTLFLSNGVHRIDHTWVA